MQAFIDHAVPLLWTMVVWPLVSALALMLFDRYLPRTDEQWAEYFATAPKRAALASFLKTAGFNLPGAMRSVRAFFEGPPPTLPKPSGKSP